MDSRTQKKATVEERLDAILEQWPESGFNVDAFLTSLLDDSDQSKFACLGQRIFIGASKIDTSKKFQLLSILYDCTKSQEFRTNPQTRLKVIKLLTAYSVGNVNINFTLGDHAVNGKYTTKEIRNKYIDILDTVLTTCELTDDQLITLLASQPTKRGSSLPRQLCSLKDLDNLSRYCNALSRLIDDEKISEAALKAIFAALKDIKFGSKMIAAYEYHGEKYETKPEIPAMMAFIGFLEKAYTKHGCNHTDLFDLDSLGYKVMHFPKTMIFEEITKKPVKELSLEELHERLKKIDNMRNSSHPLGYLMHIQRGPFFECDESAGTLHSAKFEYNKAAKEIFFRELKTLPLSEQLAKCKRALNDTMSTEYHILSQPTSFNDEYSTGINWKTRTDLQSLIRKLEDDIASHGKHYVSPSAPPKTLDYGIDCQSMTGKQIVELRVLIEPYNLPESKAALSRFTSKNPADDAELAMKIFTNHGVVAEIIHTDNPELIAHLIATFEAVAGTSTQHAWEIGQILAEQREGKSLLHEILRTKYSKHLANNSKQFNPVKQLLQMLSSPSALTSSGVISLLGMKGVHDIIPSMFIAENYDDDSNISFIRFLRDTCNSEDCAREILVMLNADCKGKKLGDLICMYHSADVVLEYILLLDKIMVEFNIPVECSKVIPNDIINYDAIIKEKLFNLIADMHKKENPQISELELCARLSQCALDENHPLGFIMHIARGLTKPRLESGALFEFAGLLHLSQTRLDELNREKANENPDSVQLFVADMERKTPPSYAESQLTVNHPAYAYPELVDQREIEKITSHAYIQLAEREMAFANPETVVQEVKSMVDAIPEEYKKPVTEHSAESKDAEKPLEAKSVLDLLFDSGNVQAEILQPTIATAPKPNAQTGLLFDLNAPEPATTESSTLKILSGIDFSQQPVIPTEPVGQVKGSPSSPQIVSLAQDDNMTDQVRSPSPILPSDSPATAAAQLAILEQLQVPKGSASQHGHFAQSKNATKTENAQKKDNKKTRVLTHAN